VTGAAVDPLAAIDAARAVAHADGRQPHRDRSDRRADKHDRENRGRDAGMGPTPVVAGPGRDIPFVAGESIGQDEAEKARQAYKAVLAALEDEPDTGGQVDLSY